MKKNKLNFARPFIRSLGINIFTVTTCLAVGVSYASAQTKPATVAKGADEAEAVESANVGPGENAAERADLVFPFTRPLQFAPQDNGLSVENPQTKWNFLSPTLVNINGLRLSSTSLQVRVTQIPRANAPAHYQNSSRAALVTTLSFKWPTILSPGGVISLESEDQKPLWSQNVSAALLADWTDEGKRHPNDLMRTGHEAANWGAYDTSLTDGPFAFLTSTKQVRLCFEASGVLPEDRLRTCSNYYAVNATDGALTLTALPTRQNPSVAINEKEHGESGIVNFNFNQPLKLKIKYADTAFVEIATRAPNMRLLDVVSSADKKEIFLTGHGERPLGKVKDLSKPVSHFWAPTGIRQENIWRVAVPIDIPTIRIQGSFNLPYTMLFTFDRIPSERDRVYIEQTRSSGTYSDAPVLFGLTPNDARISSDESEAKNTQPQRFEWTFAAPLKGAENRARLLVQAANTEKPWVVHQRLYRSFPFEASARLSGIADQSGSLNLLGELSGAAWFESLGFTQNATFSKQHWGLAARYFKSLTTLQSATGVLVNDFSVFNTDLKYHIRPGLWQYDELFGVILSIQQTNLVNFGHLAGGVGAYWARTMPKFFDDLFNFIPTLQHRKYVDMELVYYPLSLTSGYESGTTINLNFHGRVFWSDRFYGEAGFGLRRYEFSIPQKRVGIAASALYGTVGVGVVF